MSTNYLDVTRLNITINLIYKLIVFIDLPLLKTATKPVANWLITHFVYNSSK